MCGNPLNQQALKWRTPAAVSGTITLDCENRSVANFYLDNPGAITLAFENMLPGGRYRFAVGATSTTAALTLPGSAFYSGGSPIALTFTGAQSYVFEFVYYNGTIIITQEGGGSSGSFARLDANNVFQQVSISGFLGLITETAATSFVCADTDTGSTLVFTAAAAVIALLPADAPVGWNIGVVQKGTGQISFNPDTGATLSNRSGHGKSAGQYAVCTVLCVANTGGNNAEFILAGDTGL